ncbi:MAG: response regulator, partial [Blastocatellia bacterium]
MPAPQINIIHVEDDPLDTELIHQLLVREGVDCVVRRVETAEELTSAIRQGGYDLIMSDFSLPSFNGYAALKIRQALCPDIPFVLISGTLGEEAAIDAFAGGATDYILKQRLERLVPSIRRALREAAERADRLRAEAELRLAHQRLQFHIENSPLAVVELDSRQ